MGRRILIADSDAVWLDVCERSLSASGFLVETAQDGLACLGRLQGRLPDVRVPDVLVVEFEMPWGGADGVLACLRQEGIALDQSAVIVTGKAGPDILSARTGIPGSHCLQKPFHVDTLLNLVSTTSTALFD